MQKSGAYRLTYHNIMIYILFDMTQMNDNDIPIPMEHFERAATSLRVLAHPHRLAICAQLASAHVTVKQVAEHLGLPHNVVSQHLNVMKAHGLLESRRQGRTVYYRVIDPRPLWLLECIRRHMSSPTDQ